MKILLALLLASVLVGCGGNGTGDDAGTGGSRSAIEQYAEEVQPLLKRLETLNASYASVQGDNYTTDRKMFRVVSRDMPKWTALSEDLAAVRSEDEEIDEAHDDLVDSVRANQRGLTLALDAIQTQDYAALADANDSFDESVDFMADYEAAMEEIRD